MGWGDVLGGIIDVGGMLGSLFSSNKMSKKMFNLMEDQIDLAERQFAMGEQAFNMDKELRAKILSDTDLFAKYLADTLNALGPAGTSRFSNSQVITEAERRLPMYYNNVDRAVERAASDQAADLIRGGVDRSTYSTQLRRELAGKAAEEYNKAYTRAYEDALAYVSGVKQQEYAGLAAERDRRAGALQEIGTVYGSPLETRLGLLTGTGGRAPSYFQGSTTGFSDAINTTRGLYQGEAQAFGSFLDDFRSNTIPALAEQLKSWFG